jgi:hypothetical protein
VFLLCDLLLYKHRGKTLTPLWSNRYHDKSLKNLPKDLFYKFPAVLSHRTGLDCSLAHSLRPLMDRGIRTKGISDWLLELHSLRYTSDYIAYELHLERKLAFSRANDDPPMFSKFNDRKLYQVLFHLLLTCLKFTQKSMSLFIRISIKRIRRF